MDANTLRLREKLKAVLRAGRRGVSLEDMNFHINRNTKIPYSTVKEMATAARDAGVPVGELNLASREVETTPQGHEICDADPVCIAVADVFEAQEVTA